MRLVFVFLLFSLGVFAQPATTKLSFSDPKMGILMARFLAINSVHTPVSGWRVQVFATTDRVKMEEVLAVFRASHPEVYIDWRHQKPYYKVTAGAFTRKFDAFLLAQRLHNDYPSAFLMQDAAINPQELVRN